MGGEGSGKSKRATDAVERLLAAKLESNGSRIEDELLILDEEYRRGASNMSSSSLDSLSSQVVEHLDWSVRSATASPSDGLGDVRVNLAGGEKVWIEIKAQTKKRRFGDITQADFIREGTDFLRQYANREPDFDCLVTGELRYELEIDIGLSEYSDWTLEDLWLADLLLLVNDKKKRSAGATTSSGLRKFVAKKFFLQFCEEGARLIRFDKLGPIADVLAGEPIYAKLKLSNKSVASIQVSAGSPPSHASTDFTYHVGYNGAPGRHKLHNCAVSRSKDLILFELK